MIEFAIVAWWMVGFITMLWFSSEVQDITVITLIQDALMGMTGLIGVVFVLLYKYGDKVVIQRRRTIRR